MVNELGMLLWHVFDDIYLEVTGIDKPIKSNMDLNDNNSHCFLGFY